MDEERLKADITEDDVAGWDDGKWRRFQFRHMVSTNLRLSALEDKISWLSALTAIPWTIVGGFIIYLVK